MMKAVIFKGVRNIIVEDRPIPVCKYPTDVVVKVQISALCGSDLHVYRGHESSEIDIVMVNEEKTFDLIRISLFD